MRPLQATLKIVPSALTQARQRHSAAKVSGPCKAQTRGQLQPACRVEPPRCRALCGPSGC